MDDEDQLGSESAEEPDQPPVKPTKKLRASRKKAIEAEEGKEDATRVSEEAPVEAPKSKDRKKAKVKGTEASPVAAKV